MANDIAVAVSGQPIKNRTIVVGATVTGEYATQDNFVVNTPTISEIQDKYDNRFDDPRYYAGDTKD
jgi:hypothetical protein